MTKGSDLLVAALENEGVERIFGVPGEENLDVVESLCAGRSSRPFNKKAIFHPLNFDDVVPRTRSSRHITASPFANFGFKAALQF
jgi:hypothetical protein